MKRQYVTDGDLKEMGDFCSHHIKSHVGQSPGPLYHYTTGTKLIQIVQSGTLWATQAGCLNDEKELLYAIERFRDRVQASLAANLYPKSEIGLKTIARLLSDPRPELAGIFFACFSEDGDDLSQWRAYSGGESGYALRFDPKQLATEAWMRHKTALLRVEYRPENHDVLLNDMVTWTNKFYLRGIQRNRAPSPDAWAEEFAAVWLDQLAPFAACIKHPMFQGEREWRLVHWLTETDPPMQFVQRRSLISRHIPLAYGEMEGKPHLTPLTGVVIGPCRFKNASRVAVGDLLRSKKYDLNRVTTLETEIPYREV
jgi:hypothetical protein